MIKLSCILAAAAVLTAPRLPADEPVGPVAVALGDLVPDSVHQDYGALQVDHSVWGKPLQIGDRRFVRGLGTHARSEIVFHLDEPGERFEAFVGVDAAMRAYPQGGSVVFIVSGDGRELFRSGVMRTSTPALRVSVPLSGVTELKLEVTDAGDGITCDHADWAEPVVHLKAGPQRAPKPARFIVIAPSVTVRLTEDGEIAGISTGPFDPVLVGSTRLGGFRQIGATVSAMLPSGGASFTRTLEDARKHRCTLTERFVPTSGSIRWEVEILGAGEPWTAPVITRLSCGQPGAVRFWTPWSDPEGRGDAWRDPLEPKPLVNRGWHYGNATQAAPVGGDYIAIALATLLPASGQGGVSLVLSPEDALLDMSLTTTAAGQIRLARTRHRLGGGKAVRFAMDLVGHEAGWRGGLRWMVSRYPQFFDPPNPRAHQIAGCAAYSGDERPVDAARFRKMGFRVNWKLSDDFPYMGMFIPPVKDALERWTRSCDEPTPTGKTATTSCRQMNDYARWMRSQGFHVLNYFNVTEFGKNMKDVAVAASRADDPALWKDPVAFLKLKLPDAYIKPPINTCYNAWVVDVGDPAYRRFMLEQARRHIELLPDTDGLCIDRLDWLRLANPAGDDGESWVDGKPARSLYRSWQMFMDELGPLMHGADKVIFANTMTMRLELNRQLDGIYTEFGNNGGALNAAALMGVSKPVLAWTVNESLGQPNPDAFFQRHLYLGAFPTAPYPFNHHCITPEPLADMHYMEYGPLLDAMRGRTWVLAPGCVESLTPGVKVNLFRVPGGYAVPVTFGGKAGSACVRLRNLPGLDRATCTALHPAAEGPGLVSSAFKDGALELQVPLVRGCAMVRLTTATTRTP